MGSYLENLSFQDSSKGSAAETRVYPKNRLALDAMEEDGDEAEEDEENAL